MSEGINAAPDSERPASPPLSADEQVTLALRSVYRDTDQLWVMVAQGDPQAAQALVALDRHARASELNALVANLFATRCVGKRLGNMYTTGCAGDGEYFTRVTRLGVKIATARTPEDRIEIADAVMEFTREINARGRKDATSKGKQWDHAHEGVISAAMGSLAEAIKGGDPRNVLHSCDVAEMVVNRS